MSYTTERLNADAEGIRRAVELLNQGELVAFPTETVYGIGADAANSDAVKKIFEVKGRPAGHPLIVHVADTSAVYRWASEVTEAAEKLADAFWPGPLTMILPRTNLVAPEVVGDRDNIGLRVPSHTVAAALCGSFDGGIAAPSANRFGGVSPTTAQHVLDDLDGKIAAVIDGGPCEVGIESTIVELVDNEITVLRPGSITRDMLSEKLEGVDAEVDVAAALTQVARAPGMCESHYSPSTPLQMVQHPELGGVMASAVVSLAVIAPFEVETQPCWVMPKDVDGYARELYSTLRAADKSGVEQILIVPPEQGEGSEAVLDRIRKAAS